MFEDVNGACFVTVLVAREEYFWDGEGTRSFMWLRDLDIKRSILRALKCTGKEWRK